MTKKDFEAAAKIVQTTSKAEQWVVTEAFVRLFTGDNPRFDEARFRAACVPGANVRARPRKGS